MKDDIVANFCQGLVSDPTTVGGAQLQTEKNPSPGPNTKLGRTIVDFGLFTRTASSPRPFVLKYGISLLTSAPMALKWTNFAPASCAALATFWAPRC